MEGLRSLTAANSDASHSVNDAVFAAELDPT
jgi:hypothetical protein